MSKILPVIMCGGSGTRMWPESRETLPKQFIPLFGIHSTFQNTLKQLSDRNVFERPIILTSIDYRFLVAEQLAQIEMEAEIVLEPVRRDSAAAVAVAAELGALRSPEAIVVVLAADHVIQKPQLFVDLCVLAAQAAAKGKIVTLGVTPTYPATGYGYIRRAEKLSEFDSIWNVAAFVEKPTDAVAEQYIKDGYLWNSGNFIFRADVMMAEIAQFEPKIAVAAAGAVSESVLELQFRVLNKEALSSAPRKSIDYAVMEFTKKAAVTPADIGWSDVGTWSSVLEHSEQDENGNSLRGRSVVMNASNVLVRSHGAMTAVIGISNVVVITTPDAVLVVDARQTDKVKALVDKLKLDGHREAVEHKRIYRPWGYYQGVDEGSRHQVKRIVVKPHGRLSLQKHFHRAEHWVVVQGAAEVTLDGNVSVVHENESIYLPMGSVHRLANPGKIDLELIEVQTGSYLGEDDIIRIEDVYNRD